MATWAVRVRSLLSARWHSGGVRAASGIPHSHSRTHNTHHRYCWAQTMMRGLASLRVPGSRYAWLLLSISRVRHVGIAPVPLGCHCPDTDTRQREAWTRSSGAGGAPAPVAVRAVGIRRSAAERSVTAPPRGRAVGDAWSDTPHCQAQPSDL